MTTARSVVTGALTFHLNRLSPGETLDPDTGAVCLDALNAIVDEFNGGMTMLFRDVITQSTALSGTFGTIGTDWTGLVPGVEIVGATVQYSAGLDTPLDSLTVAEYLSIPLKATASIPHRYAYDGLSTVYLYPAAAGQTVKLLTRQAAANFADLDTDYVLPQGYKARLQAILAEKLAPTLGGITPAIAAAARGARLALAAKNSNPAIINGRGARGNILAGF